MTKPRQNVDIVSENKAMVQIVNLVSKAMASGRSTRSHEAIPLVSRILRNSFWIRIHESLSNLQKSKVLSALVNLLTPLIQSYIS